MKWYIAELIVECQVGREPASLWDQQLVVLRARSADAAYLAAMRIGKGKKMTYDNSAGQKVRWKFNGLGDLQEILTKTIRSGIEVHSRLVRSKRPRTCTKRKLTVFWAQRNLQKTAGELLGHDLRPFAPRSGGA